MGYLITHIAISLVFAQLLGLLLGWLLWGYVARQRGREVQTLRQRMADMQILFTREMAPAEPRMALADGPSFLTTPSPASIGVTSSRRSLDQNETRDVFSRHEALPRSDSEEIRSETRRPGKNIFFDNETPDRPPVRHSFFGDREEELEPQPFLFAPLAEFTETEHASAEQMPAKPATVKSGAADPPEAKDARLLNLQEQVRELQGLRERLPLLQADLSNAIAGRRTAEAKFQESKNDFEVRSRGLLSQIRDYEEAAAEWDCTRDAADQQRINLEKELSAVRATLRDVQNSQRPQTVHSGAAASVHVAPPSNIAVKDIAAAELADLRERCQKAISDRESMAAEFEIWKQSAAAKTGQQRLVELDEALRLKDTQLAEQAARVESLLWRVAELEPFAGEAAQRDESFRRQETEIAGHMAMHEENAKRIRVLQDRLNELESTSISSHDLQRILAQHQDELRLLTDEHDQRSAEWQRALSMKDSELSEHVSDRVSQITLLSSLQSQLAAQMAEHETATQQLTILQIQIHDRDAEIESLRIAQGKLQRSTDDWKANEFQRHSAEHQEEIRRLTDEHNQRSADWRRALALKDGELSERVLAHQSQTDLLTNLQAQFATQNAQHAAAQTEWQRHVADLHQSLAARDIEIADRALAHQAESDLLHNLQSQLAVQTTELHTAALRLKLVEQQVHDRDTDLHRQQSAFDELQLDLEGWKAHAKDLELEAGRLPEVQSLLNSHAAELQRLKDSHADKEGQLTFLQERLNAMSSRLSAHQQRLSQLEPLAVRAPELEQKLVELESQSNDRLKALDDQHHSELTRLKVNSAQRIRRLRQSMTAFKF